MRKALLIFLIAAIPFVARADNSKISPDLHSYPANQTAQVIVQYAPGRGQLRRRTGPGRLSGE